jgi:hypothetical protein
MRAGIRLNFAAYIPEHKITGGCRSAGVVPQRVDAQGDRSLRTQQRAQSLLPTTRNFHAANGSTHRAFLGID